MNYQKEGTWKYVYIDVFSKLRPDNDLQILIRNIDPKCHLIIQVLGITNLATSARTKDRMSSNKETLRAAEGTQHWLHVQPVTETATSPDNFSSVFP